MLTGSFHRPIAIYCLENSTFQFLLSWIVGVGPYGNRFLISKAHFYLELRYGFRRFFFVGVIIHPIRYLDLNAHITDLYYRMDFIRLLDISG